MVRGVSLTVPDRVGSFLYDVLSMINFNEFSWCVDGEDVYKENNEGLVIPLFEKNIYSGVEFVRKIKLNSYYARSAEIGAFPKNKDITKIITFDDFLSSDCEIIILISDNVSYEIYCKDLMLLRNIFKNAMDRRYDEIACIDERGHRCAMYQNQIEHSHVHTHMHMSI